ncbi:Proofreading thioesterase EntH [Rhynchospora pubera]|uniref:Proofreading thioesterase EntH n=1 Tax=Rhynchospora pubera TaxID=906938 RepID=A0AAV8D3G2_9POAL|nr:Proofreading thioesterase EntH [Rhynchospora pubera]
MGDSKCSIGIVVDAALELLGFNFTLISPTKVTGRLTVAKHCCQPFRVLNGGVSALIAESTASLGAYCASGYKRVAGVQLSINHIKPAMLGDEVQAEAVPVQVGRSIQVWEVKIWRTDSLTPDKKLLVSTSRVTLLSNLPTPSEMNSYADAVKLFSKL